MKNVVIYFGAFGLSALNAQTLTETTHQPEIGNVEYVRQMDTTGFSAGTPNATSGANSMWDFSSAVPMSSATYTNKYSSTSAYPNGTLFPEANMVQDLPGDMFTYFKWSPTPTAQTEIAGIDRPGIIMSFTNTGIVVQYPASLGFQVTDNVAGTYSIGAMNGPVTGDSKTVADATGTLTLAPGVVFTDVIRLKCVQTLTLTQGTLTGYVTQVVYNYYSASQRFPIVNMSYISQTIGTNPPTVTAGLFVNADNYATVGIKENGSLADAVKVFPNPVSELINLNSGVEVKHVSLYNVTGQKILDHNGNGAIDVSAVVPGIYNLKIETSSGPVSRKVVVSH